MDIRVVHKAGHYEVYVDSVFLCSADTYDEAFEEIEKMLKMN